MTDEKDSDIFNVLVVDDERRFAEAHARMLQDDFSVEVANGGQAGLKTISEEFDALVVDRNMPTMSGEELVAEVNNMSFDCATIMITAVEPDVDIVDLGVDDYLIKPVSSDELIDAVTEAIEWQAYDETLQDYFSLSNKREVLLESGSNVARTEQFAEIEADLIDAAEQSLQKSEEILQTLIQSSPAAIIALDKEGKVDIWNPRAEQLFGWASDDVVGDDPPLFTAGDESVMDSIRAELFAERTVTDRLITCETISGNQLDISLSAAPLYDNNMDMYGMMFVLNDISERKQQKQRLSVLSRLLRHNIRNELNVVRGRTEMLRDELPADQHEHVDIAIDTIDTLIQRSRKANVVHELLDSDETSVEPQDIKTLIAEPVMTARSEYDDVKITVVLDAETTIVEASDGLSEAIAQLIENAIEHNDSDEPVVRITVSTELIEGQKRCLVDIADNGPGIPSSEIKVLDNEQEDSLDHGSGIGLWTIKWIVDQSGGTLLFEDSDLGGTRVRLRLLPSDVT